MINLNKAVLKQLALVANVFCGQQMDLCAFLFIIGNICKFACSRGVYYDNHGSGCINEKWGRMCPSIHKIEEIRQAAINRTEHVFMNIEYNYNNVQMRIDNAVSCLEQYETQLSIAGERTNQMVSEVTLLYNCITTFDVTLTSAEDKVTNINRMLNNIDNRYDRIMGKLDQIESNIKDRQADKRFIPPGCKVNILTGRNCTEVYNNGGHASGVYYITTGSDGPIPVWCDMDDDRGGWTVIQNRENGSVSFDRTWEEYKHGFGDIGCHVAGSYWLGNEHIHRLTIDTVVQLKIELTPWQGNERHALYRFFRIGNEEEGYSLRYIDGYTADPEGNIGNAFDSSTVNCHDEEMRSGAHKSMLFTTKDRDNDLNSTGNCADRGGGGWWYNNCYSVNLNGMWYEDGHSNGMTNSGPNNFDNPLLWTTWKGCWESLKSTRMKIRPFKYYPRKRTIKKVSSPTYFSDDANPPRVQQLSLSFRAIRTRRHPRFNN